LTKKLCELKSEIVEMRNNSPFMHRFFTVAK